MGSELIGKVQHLRGWLLEAFPYQATKVQGSSKHWMMGAYGNIWKTKEILIENHWKPIENVGKPWKNQRKPSNTLHLMVKTIVSSTVGVPLNVKPLTLGRKQVGSLQFRTPLVSNHFLSRFSLTNPLGKRVPTTCPGAKGPGQWWWPPKVSHGCFHGGTFDVPICFNARGFSWNHRFFWRYSPVIKHVDGKSRKIHHP